MIQEAPAWWCRVTRHGGRLACLVRHIAVLRNFEVRYATRAIEIKRALVIDGTSLSVADAILILRKIVGLIERFPVEK